jgi:hypothetical protein
MQATAAGLLDQLLLTQPVMASKPIVVHAVYASVEGGATDCPPAADGSCRASSEFDLGAIVDPDLDVDLTAQAQAYNALLLEFSAGRRSAGSMPAATDPMAALLDKSTSPHGKPAQDVLTFWFRSWPAGSSSASPDQPQRMIGRLRRPPSPLFLLPEPRLRPRCFITR